MVIALKFRNLPQERRGGDKTATGNSFDSNRVEKMREGY